jgi:ribosomal protein L24
MAFQIGDKVKIKKEKGGGSGHVLRADDQNFILIATDSATKIQNSSYFEAGDLIKVSADEFPIKSSNVKYVDMIQNLPNLGRD